MSQESPFTKPPWKFDSIQNRLNAVDYFYKNRLGIIATLDQQVAFATLMCLDELIATTKEIADDSFI